MIFSLKIEETYTFAEKNFKYSVEAIKNTAFCKLHKLTKGLRPMGSNADRSALWCISRWRRICKEDWIHPMIVSFPFPSSPGHSLFSSPQPPHDKKRPLGRRQWGGQVGIVLLITISEYPLQITWLYLTWHDKQQLYTVPSSQTGQ